MVTYDFKELLGIICGELMGLFLEFWWMKIK
jgi:hypothetical protein